MKCNKTNSAHGGYVASSSNKSNQATMPKPTRNEKIDMSFDHLSVVSEECLSNSDDQANNKLDGDACTVKDPIYTNFQSTIPPLKHFESLSYKDIGPNIGKLWGKLIIGSLRFTMVPIYIVHTSSRFLG